MGQKVNPISFRLIEKKDWRSLWFAQKDYPLLLLEDLTLRDAIREKLGKLAGIDRVEIKRDQQEIVIDIQTSKPGIIIGRSGQGIDDLKKFLEKKLLRFRNLNKNIFPRLKKIKSPRDLIPRIKINIIEIRVAELSANLMAQNIATQLEKRIAYRRAVKQTMKKIMEKGAKGIKIAVAGRLGGVEIARKEKFSQGSIPLRKIKADIDYGQIDAFTTYGVIGVKVWIYKAPKAPTDSTDEKADNTDKSVKSV